MIKIISMNFDKRTKIIMCIAIIIAICIIIYNCFSIYSIKDKVSNNIDLSRIVAFEAKSEITINSNKNSNNYIVKEIADIEKQEYSYLVENGLQIDIVKDKVNISNYEKSYELLNNHEFENYNYISISSIIKLFNDINNCTITGKITQVTQDNSCIYKIYFEGKKANYIEINIIDNIISEIKVYEDYENMICYIKVEEFIVKKSS